MLFGKAFFPKERTRGLTCTLAPVFWPRLDRTSLGRSSVRAVAKQEFIHVNACVRTSLTSTVWSPIIQPTFSWKPGERSGWNLVQWIQAVRRWYFMWTLIYIFVRWYFALLPVILSGSVEARHWVLVRPWDSCCQYAWPWESCIFYKDVQNAIVPLVALAEGWDWLGQSCLFPFPSLALRSFA